MNKAQHKEVMMKPTFQIALVLDTNSSAFSEEQIMKAVEKVSVAVEQHLTHQPLETNPIIGFFTDNRYDDRPEQWPEEA